RSGRVEVLVTADERHHLERLVLVGFEEPPARLAPHLLRCLFGSLAVAMLLVTGEAPVVLLPPVGDQLLTQLGQRSPGGEVGAGTRRVRHQHADSHGTGLGTQWAQVRARAQGGGVGNWMGEGEKVEDAVAGRGEYGDGRSVGAVDV